MKKTFLLLVALVATVVGASAQGQTATLQQGDKMTPFYGPDAFVQAYNAAQKGAVITLSAGTFNTVDSVMKEITIIGNGYKENKTVIKEKFYDVYTLKENKVPISLIIRANNVKLEGLDMNCVIIKKSDHLTFRHCRIYNLFGNETSTASWPTGQHKNTVIDQCVIGVDKACDGENYCIKNSIIGAFLFSDDQKASTGTLVCNCLFACVNGKDGSSTLPHAVYKNCLMGVYMKEGNEIYDNSKEFGYEFYNNVFFRGIGWSNDKGREDGRWNIVLSLDKNSQWTTPELNWQESQTCKGNIAISYDDVFGESDEENPLYAPIVTTIKGDDGTVVGPYGGTGFSINPSIPRIVESKIDSNTDADGKLNVKIKVEVNN